MPAEDLSSTKLKCSQCPKEFKYESEKRRHELSHSPQFQCNVCSKKFSFVSEFSKKMTSHTQIIHKTKHHTQTKFEVSKVQPYHIPRYGHCEFSALRRHEKQHNRNGSVSCTECGKKFRDETLLKRHMNYAHKGTYNCKKCSSTFNSEVALRTHTKSHRPVSERQFRCSFDGCKKTFNFPHHLKHHELTHTNRKQHFCNVCGKGFIQLHHLKTHIKTHDSENWLKCVVSDCNKQFSTEYAIKRHLATHENKLGYRVILKSKSVRCSSVKLKNIEAVQDKKDNTKVPKSNVSEKDPTSPLDLKNQKLQSNDTNTINDDMKIMADCKTVLGSCLMSGDPKEDDCLCAQMTHNEDEPYDLTPIAKKKYTSSNDTKSDTKQNYCDGCECAIISNVNKTNVKNSCDPNKDDVNPNIEYGVDGIVKLRDTFDIDIPKNIVIHKDIDNIVPNEIRMKSVPYNSCKAVLGKCIVSGSGIISENCLCAKMHFDELQVLAEEVEDIIPQPNQPQLGSFVI